MLDQRLGVPFAPRSRFRAYVDEIPGVGVVFAEDVAFGVVQQGEKFIEEALLAFLGELPVEAKHTTPQHSTEIVHILVWGHPNFLEGLRVSVVFYSLLDFAFGQCARGVWEHFGGDGIMA